VKVHTEEHERYVKEFWRAGNMVGKKRRRIAKDRGVRKSRRRRE